MMRLLKIVLTTCLLAGNVIIARAQNEQTTREAEKFETLLRIVNYAYVDSVNSHKMVEDAIVGMLKDLDPHSAYISKEDLKKMNEPLVGNFEGIGIQFNIFHDTIMVIAPISGGPSEKLGIRAGDKIVTIEGKTVAGVGIKNDDVTSSLRGKKGTQVAVGIKRRGVKKLLDFTITRDKIPIFSVDAHYMATPETGYIKVNRFAAKTVQEFEKALDTLQHEGMKNLILDLRGNSGGYLQTAIDLADEFLGSRKVVVFTKGRSFPRKDEYASSSGMFEKGKLIVLVDEGSASASEIVSGAIQDWDRGMIMGRRTFGKGLVQKPYMLPDGSAIRLTISRYYTPTGRCIQKPYDGGVEKYYKDYVNRFKHGEYFHADSIHFPDSLKFFTPSKRVVYGGGGIMPDLFVPLDTSMNSDYYTKVASKGLLHEFALSYADKHRNELHAQYSSPKAFLEGFNANGSFLDEFVAFAKEKKVDADEAGLKRSGPHLANNLKARVASNLWNSSAYYMVFNSMDRTFLRAVSTIEDDSIFKKMKLAVN